MLGAHGAMRLSELSDHLHIAPRSATEVVDALEARGLVERRPDPADRRATLVELTEDGARVLDAIRAARGTEAERVFDRLSATDRAHLGPHPPQAQGLSMPAEGPPGSANPRRPPPAGRAYGTTMVKDSLAEPRPLAAWTVTR